MMHPNNDQGSRSPEGTSQPQPSNVHIDGPNNGAGRSAPAMVPPALLSIIRQAIKEELDALKAEQRFAAPPPPPHVPLTFNEIACQFTASMLDTLVYQQRQIIREAATEDSIKLVRAAYQLWNEQQRAAGSSGG